MQPAEVIRYRLTTTRLLDQRISSAGEGRQEAATIELQQCGTGRRPFPRRGVAVILPFGLTIGTLMDQEVVRLVRLAPFATAVAFGVPVVELR
jgi:hypothetical protein